MSTAPRRRALDPEGVHVATIAHDGRLWDTYLEFDDDPKQPQSYRGLLRFEVAASDDEAHSARTTVIIIEDSYEEAVAKAGRLDGRVLECLLRSALPEDE